MDITTTSHYYKSHNYPLRIIIDSGSQLSFTVTSHSGLSSMVHDHSNIHSGRLYISFLSILALSNRLPPESFHPSPLTLKRWQKACWMMVTDLIIFQRKYFHQAKMSSFETDLIGPSTFHSSPLNFVYYLSYLSTPAAGKSQRQGPFGFAGDHHLWCWSQFQSSGSPSHFWRPPQWTCKGRHVSRFDPKPGKDLSQRSYPLRWATHIQWLARRYDASCVEDSGSLMPTHSLSASQWFPFTKMCSQFAASSPTCRYIRRVLMFESHEMIEYDRWLKGLPWLTRGVRKSRPAMGISSWRSTSWHLLGSPPQLGGALRQLA